MNILSFIIGLAIGVIAALILYVQSRTRSARTEERLAMTGAELAEQEQAAREWKAEENRLEAEINRLHGELEGVRATLKSEREASTEKLKILTEAKEQLRQEFENLANKIFEDKSRKFVGENAERLQEILKPLREQLGDFRKKVEDVYDKEGKERASLLKEITILKDLNHKISDEASNLTRALKGESKTRGNWGELILERVLEQSGLSNGREYETQMHLRERQGGQQTRYPDVVVHLPEGRDVVIDAKVTLNSYERYMSANDADERARALKEHIAAVRNHVRELSEKNYQDLEGIHPMELVIMCVPNEPAFISAVSEDPGLHEDAFSRRVLIVGPTTLLLTLRIIATMWRTEDQNRNALAIAERGQYLYEKFVGFAEDLEAVGASIDKAGEAYRSAHGKLTSGSGNLVGQARKLIDLGVKTRKQLPPSVLNEETQGESTNPEPE